MNCTHCWHNEPYVLTSYPPQQPQTCCHCGERRILKNTYTDQLNQGHGKFAPQWGGLAK